MYLRRVLLGFWIAVTLMSTYMSFVFLTQKGKTHIVLKPNATEKYKSVLSERLTTLNALSDSLNQYTNHKGIRSGTLKYVEVANQLVEERFCFSYSHYSYEENPYLYLLGKYVWGHLSAVVIPDDLLKYNHGACSQQSIVLMELLKKNGIKVRKVALIGHFCLEALVGENWYFFDPTIEPLMSNDSNMRIFSSKNKDRMLATYTARSHEELMIMFSEYAVGPVNEFPATHVIWLHRLSFVMLYVGPLFSVLLGGLLWYRKITPVLKPTESKATKAQLPIELQV